jgi:hypothetical protein
MNQKENLLYLSKSDHAAIKTVIGDITEERSTCRVNRSVKYIGRRTGPLIYPADSALGRMAGKTDSRAYMRFPGKWLTILGPGLKLFEDPDRYPFMAELNDRLLELHKRVCTALESFPDKKLNEEIAIVPRCESRSPRAVRFTRCRDFHHLSRISITGKKIGQGKGSRSIKER